ncbi:MAG: PadR family transcriptional regulator [Alphaproteobacteria bacterium]|nr:PadR family transcriptional regulator [Alphaproteobacteria bacterium]
MAPRRNRSPQTRLLLTVLRENPSAWQHGYELSKATGLKSGTLYPLLIRLQEQGFLEARWEEAERPGKPPRHAYKITTSGKQLAQSLVRAKQKNAVYAGLRGKPA